MAPTTVGPSGGDYYHDYYRRHRHHCILIAAQA